MQKEPKKATKVWLENECVFVDSCGYAIMGGTLAVVLLFLSWIVFSLKQF
jgi:hypothetical protein